MLWINGCPLDRKWRVACLFFVPAAEASTQMNPAVSEGDALVTDVRRRLDDDH